MLEDLTPPKKIRRCGVRTTRGTLDADDQKRLDDAIASPEWSTHALALAFADRGVRISYQVLYRHRAKQCACFRQ